MGTGDRREGRASYSSSRRPSSGGSRGPASDPNGLLGRYGESRPARGADRLDGRVSERLGDRGSSRSPSRSRLDDDDRYSGSYGDRPASSRASGRGGERSRGLHDDDDGDRHAPRARSRENRRDVEPFGVRGADRYGAERSGRAAGGNGRYADARRDRQRRGAEPARKNSRRTMVLVALAVAIVALPPLLIFGVWPRIHGFGSQVNTTFPWADSSQHTAPIAGNDAFANQKDAVDPAFAAYYSAHAGATTLGTPLTPGILTRSGIVQFYAYGALLTAAPAPTSGAGGTSGSATPTGTTAPKASATTTPPLPGDSALQLVGDGPKLTGAAAASASGSSTASSTPGATGSATPSATPSATSPKVVELPVVAALLKAGSQTPLTAGATTTYVDLRGLASPDHLVGGTQPATLPTGTPSQPVFIATSTQSGTQGHNIPAALWAYITDPTVSPAGWQTDVGAPLAEAQSVTVTQSDATHHLLIQAFWNAVLIADADTLTSAHPTITRGSIGGDYLLTLGPPALAVTANTQAWALGSGAVLDAPISGNATVHVGQNFPLALTGESKWDKATLWFGASWSAGASRNGKGWIAGASLTFQTPDPSQPAQASFDALSPDLANYLSQQGKNMGVALYDVTRNTYYGYNDSGEFYLASTAKVYIMCSYLDWLEGQGRQPSGNELYWLQTMIENSDNNSAQALFNTEGHAPRQAQYLAKLGISGYIGYGDFWGWAQLPPSAMATVLTDLQQGKILNDSDRKLAFNLMGHIESDQRMGIGVTAPQGATYYMKDGWVPEPDNLWALNSTGIVTVGNETYALAVYSKENQNYDWSMVEHVCSVVGKSLVG